MKITTKTIYECEFTGYKSDDFEKVKQKEIDYYKSNTNKPGDKIRSYTWITTNGFKSHKSTIQSIWEVIHSYNGSTWITNGRENRICNSRELKAYSNPITIQNDNFYDLFIHNKSLCKSILPSMIEEIEKQKHDKKGNT